MIPPQLNGWFVQSVNGLTTENSVTKKKYNTINSGCGLISNSIMSQALMPSPYHAITLHWDSGPIIHTVQWLRDYIPWIMYNLASEQH